MSECIYRILVSKVCELQQCIGPTREDRDTTSPSVRHKEHGQENEAFATLRLTQKQNAQ